KPLSALTSKYTNTALSAQSAQIDGMHHVTQHINQRLWDTPEKGRGLWLMTEYAKQKKHSTHYRNYEHTHQLSQIGADQDVVGNKGTLLLGAALSHNKGKQNFAEGSGDSDLLLGSIYGKWFAPNRVFLTFDGGLGVGKQKLKLDDSQAQYRQNIAHLGISAGQTWQLGGFEMQPAIGVRYQYFSGSQYALNGATIKQDKQHLLAYQAGLRLAHNWHTPSGALIKPYYRGTYTRLSGDIETRVNEYRFALPLSHYWQHQAGLALEKGRWGAQIYANHEHGSQQSKRNGAGVMLQYRW
ncbi:outer membrane autotransporter barrel domain-containing protein, partial [Alysiella filiformis DSM 16848]